jgi:L-alanine-DL-glutamate epimerase-like enolase superfamily enzyme
VPPTPDAAALAARLAALPLVVEEVRCAPAAVRVPSYPGGVRPSAVVTLAGARVAGSGEHVAWTAEEHARLAATAPALAPLGSWRLGEWAAALASRTSEPYARAALEAAAVDLACRQAATSLFVLAGAPPRPVRYVVSFERRADPAAEMRRQLAAAPWLRFKVDADPSWSDGVLAELAALGAVAVLDFKETGRHADCERARGALPEVLLEDPPAGIQTHLSADASVRRAADVAALAARPAAVNVKPARMGGVFEALACFAACAADGIAVYCGGMFEVGVGRAQLRVLASLFSPDGPNDVAPIAVGDASAPRPRMLACDLGRVGFGAQAA